MIAKKIQPTRRIFTLLLLGACLSPSLKAESAPSPAQLSASLRRLIPNSEPKAIDEVSALPGSYQNHMPGGIAEVYLFPDQTYSWIQYSDIGTDYDEGRWSFAGGVVTTVSSGAVAETTAGKTIQLNAVALTVGEKRLLYLVRGDPTDTSGDDPRRNAALDPRIDADLQTSVNAGVFLMVTLAKNRELNAGEITALKTHFDEDYGRHSLNEVLFRYKLSAGRIRKIADGTFLLTPTGTPDDRQAETAIAAFQLGSITLGLGKNDGTGLVEITIAGVKLRAKRIEISHDMNSVKLSGSAEVVGGKLPEAPGITIFIEGKQVSPPAAP